MAKTLGEDYRLFVQTAVADTFVEPKGQGNLVVNRSSSPVDTTTKDTGRFGTSKPGQKSVSLQQEFIPDLPDTGYARIKTLEAGDTVEVYQIRQKPFADDDVVFECRMNAVFGNSTLNRGAAAATSLTLTADEAPTVDDV